MAFHYKDPAPEVLGSEVEFQEDRTRMIRGSIYKAQRRKLKLLETKVKTSNRLKVQEEGNSPQS